MSICSGSQDIEFLKKIQHRYYQLVNHLYYDTVNWDWELPGEYNRKLGALFSSHIYRMVDIVSWLLIWSSAQTGKKINLLRVITEEKIVSEWDAQNLLIEVYLCMSRHLDIVNDLFYKLEEGIIRDYTPVLYNSFNRVKDDLNSVLLIHLEIEKYLSSNNLLKLSLVPIDTYEPVKNMDIEVEGIVFLRHFHSEYKGCLLVAYKMFKEFNWVFIDKNDQYYNELVIGLFEKMIDIIYWVDVWHLSRTGRKLNMNKDIKEENIVILSIDDLIRQLNVELNKSLSVILDAFHMVDEKYFSESSNFEMKMERLRLFNIFLSEYVLFNDNIHGDCDLENAYINNFFRKYVNTAVVIYIYCCSLDVSSLDEKGLNTLDSFSNIVHKMAKKYIFNSNLENA